MGAYYCVLCDRIFCHHEVNCYEYGKNNLICEDCHIKLEDEKNEKYNIKK